MKRNAYWKYFAALALFGSNGVVSSRIALTSYEIVFLRSLFGGLLLAAIFLSSGRRFTVLRHRRDFCLIALSSAAMAADWLLLFEAYARIGVSLGMLINYCGPAIVMAASPVLFHERITGGKFFAFTAAIAGVFCISGEAVVEGVNAVGLLCAGLSALSYAAMVICNKYSREITGMENSTVQLLSALAVVTVYLLFRQGLFFRLSGGDWLPALWLGLVNTGIGCWFYFSSIGALPVQTVAICGYLEPLSAVALSALFLHETMGPMQILGAALILGGAALGELSGKGRGMSSPKAS